MKLIKAHKEFLLIDELQLAKCWFYNYSSNYLLIVLPEYNKVSQFNNCYCLVCIPTLMLNHNEIESLIVLNFMTFTIFRQENGKKNIIGDVFYISRMAIVKNKTTQFVAQGLIFHYVSPHLTRFV